MAKLKRRQVFAWRPVVIYVLAVAASGAALFVWERAYEARQAPLLKPPPPEVLARILVERLVGPGSVQSVTLDTKTGTLDLVVKDVVSKDAKTPDQKRKFLSVEGTQAIQSVLSEMVTLKKVTVRLVNNGKVLATVRAEPGVRAPTTEFAPDLK